MPFTVIGHEAFCLNSMQDRLFFVDDFLGQTLKDEWLLTTVGVGSAGALIDSQDGGVYRLTAGPGITRVAYLFWNTIRSLLASKRVTMEVRCKLNTTSLVDVNLSLWFSALNLIEIKYDNWAGGDITWKIHTIRDFAETEFDSGVTPDTSYHIFRIECHTYGGNHVHFYVDGLETDNSPIATNIPPYHLEPFLSIRPNETVAKTFDIDYVAIRQDR